MSGSENKGSIPSRSTDSFYLAQPRANGAFRRPPRWLQYSLAVSMTGASLLIFLISSRAFDNRPAPIIFLIPVVISAYLGGLGPGLVSTILGVISADYFTTPPFYSFQIVHPIDYVRLGSLLVVGVLVSILSESLHRAKNALQPQGAASHWLPLERKIRVTFGFAVICLVLIGAISYRVVKSLRVNDEWVDHTHQVMASLTKLLSTVTDGETGVRGYVITGEESYLAPYDSAMAGIAATQHELRALTRDNPVQQRNLDALDQLVADRLSIMRTQIELRRTQGFAVAQAEVATQRGKAAQDRVRVLVTQMLDVETALLKDRDARAERSSFVAKIVILSGSLATLLAVTVALFLIGEDFTAKRRLEASLAEAQAELEERVVSRTQALADTNEQLRQSELQLRLMISGVKDYAIFMLDPAGRVISWNDGATRIKGYTSEEIVGEHFSRFYSLADQKSGKPARELQEALEKGRYEEEGPRLRKDGSTFWATVVITALYDDSGELRGFSKVTRDTSHRRKLEQELHTLAAVVQNCRDFIGVCSPDMKTAYLNEAGLSMVGLDSLEAARNTPVIDYFWPEDRPMILERAVPILMRDGNWRGEVRFRNFKTGEPIHTVWDAFAVRDETGQTTGYATISPNLERMKQLQTALSEADKILRDTEARHAGIVSSPMDAIITVNDKQKIQVFNLAAEKMFLCPAAQALGQPLSTFIPERFRGAHSGHIHKFGENGSTSRAMGALTSLWGLRSNGEEFPIEASISKMNTNGDKLFTAIVRDITERLKSAEALRRSDVTRMMALDSARLGDWQLDLQTGAATRSLLHDEIFGYTDKQPEWNFDIFMSHVHPDDRERIAHTFKECLDEQRKWDFECRILWPDQSIHWIWACGSHYKDETGKSTHVMGTVADITERKRADELRLRSQKLEGLGTLSGGIAHDFNNILLAITGNAKLAIADLPPDHPVQQSLAEIAKAGSRATDLVRRILTFSRPGEVKRQVCLLQPIVEEALKLVRATIPATVEFRTAFAPNLPAVLADSTQIHQIIVNLATNAAHAIGSKSDGRIEIQLDSATLTADDISPALNLSEGPYVRLRVSDNGCGMDRATLNRIFDPFFTTKGPGEGTGLGLSVVHGIMKNHDGGISVYSEPGSGTAFRLFFPAAAAALIAAAPAAAAPIERVCTERVLYVDDEQALVMLVTRTLGRLGYKVTGQTDPLAAVALFRSDPSAFDVVVTDLAMPQLSGFDLSSQLLAIRPDLPIVMTSGYVRPEDQQRAVQLGVRDLILKPDTIDQLGRTLDRVLQHHLTDPQPIAR